MRLVKTVVVLVVVLAAVVGGAALGLRVARNKVGETSQVKPGFVTVANAMRIGLYGARVAPGSNVILFDTGLDPEGKPVDAILAALGARRDDVTDVFLTHGHFDHVAGARGLAKARIHLGAADVALASGQAQPDGLLPMIFGKILATPPVKIDAPLSGVATIDVGRDATGATRAVKAFPVPGHTAGSYVFLYDGVLVAGDIMVLSQGRLDPTPRAFDPHPDQNRAAIRSLKAQLADETVDIVCTAHGGCTPKGLGKMLLDDLISRVGG